MEDGARDPRLNYRNKLWKLELALPSTPERSPMHIVIQMLGGDRSPPTGMSRDIECKTFVYAYIIY